MTSSPSIPFEQSQHIRLGLAGNAYAPALHASSLRHTPHIVACPFRGSNTQTTISAGGFLLHYCVDIPSYLMPALKLALAPYPLHLLSRHQHGEPPPPIAGPTCLLESFCCRNF